MSKDVKSRARVRWAKPEDYPAVLAIHEFVYDGGDYLPVMYHVFLQRKEADCFVLEVDGEIVAFKVMHETPDCASLVSVAMRISTRYQKYGLAGFMEEECLKLSLEKRPWIKTIIYSSMLTPYIKRTMNEENEDGKVKTIAPKHQYFINREQLVTSLVHIQASLRPDITCTRCSKADFRDIILKFMENLPRNDILPGGENWFPYRITYQDLKYLTVYNQPFFIRRQNSERDDCAKISALGYMHTWKCPLGTRSHMYIWCENIDQYKALLAAMINHCVKITKPGDCVVFDVALFRDTSADIIEYLTPILGCSYMRSTDRFKEGVIVEKPISRTFSKL